jgi:uncharacterized membrane protein YraQ (UPF0718 family)
VITEADRPIGAPVLPESRRDRVSVWVAEHPWAVPAFRLVGGLTLVVVVALVFRADFPWDKIVAFVVGSVLGDAIGEREKERGDTFRESSAESAYVDQRAATQSDSRYFRPPHM